MNCIPGMGIAWRRALCPVIIAFLAPALTAGAASTAPAYRIDYVVTPRPELGGARVELKLRQPRRLLRELDMQLAAIDPASIEADGVISVAGGRIAWKPGDEGGSLSWFVPVDHLRADGEYDAHINSSWALFRAEDIIPAARTRTVRDAVSETHITFKLPAGWSSVTQYFGRNDSYAIHNPERRFDQPSGWILLGNIGTRNDDIAGIRVVVAGPVGHAVRRLDLLALLQWTLPDLLRILPEFPKRLTIVSAGDPMWRGGLSAPASLYLHAERPLISENGTSSLLHEVMHVGLGLRAGHGMDWIVEGLAEYYGLELLRRSGTISPRRHASALKNLREWGADVTRLCSPRASGAVTARAVTVLRALDRELRSNPETVNSLDDFVHDLVTHGNELSLAALQDIGRKLHGSVPDAIASGNLPGCAN